MFLALSGPEFFGLGGKCILATLRSTKQPRTFQNKQPRFFAEKQPGTFQNKATTTLLQLNNLEPSYNSITPAARIRIAADVLQVLAANPPSTC